MNYRELNKQLIIGLIIFAIIFISCQLDEKNMIEDGVIHNIFLGNVYLKSIEYNEKIYIRE